MSITASLDNFEAASEFGDYPNGTFDTDTRVACGQRACSVLQHVKNPALALDSAEIIGLVNDMRAKGYPVAGGTTPGELAAYFSKFGSLDIRYEAPYGTPWDGPHGIHQLLLDHAGREGIVLEVEQAFNLTGNEPGVYRHYIAIGAIHPTLGYLVANGDDVLALAGHGGHGKVIPCRWMDKNVLAAARPSAALVVYGLPHNLSVPASALARPTAHLDAAGFIVDAQPANATSSAEVENTAAISSHAAQSTDPRELVAQVVLTLAQTRTQLYAALDQLYAQPC